MGELERWAAAHHAKRPLSVASLVEVVRFNVDQVEEGESYAHTLTISTFACLLGELLIASPAGGIYKTPNAKLMAEASDPLQALRNVLCHPADASFLETLLPHVATDSENMAESVRTRRDEAQGPRLARWALVKLNAIGVFRLHEIIAERAKRFVGLSREGVRRLENVRLQADLERVLERSPTARSETVRSGHEPS